MKRSQLLPLRIHGSCSLCNTSERADEQGAPQWGLAAARWEPSASPTPDKSDNRKLGFARGPKRLGPDRCCEIRLPPVISQ